MGWRASRKNAAERNEPRPFASRDASDPRGLVALAIDYLQWMEVKNYSPTTRYHRERYLDRFIGWCELRSLARPTEITRPVLERYQRWRRFDSAFSATVMDGLNRLFSTGAGPVQALRNAGLRIDHFLLSPEINGKLKAEGVDHDVRGWEKSSDHCPVWIEI